jgi:ATP-binding cassette subfamily F protein 3
MISVNQLSLHFGSFELFRNISFLINQRDRIGLVGRNGSGKTSLLKIITGEINNYEGTVSKPSGISFGYLPQQVAVSDSKSVFEEAISAFDEVLMIEQKILHISKELQNRKDFQSEAYLKLIHDLAEANDRFQIIGGTTIHAEVEQTLLGLGFLTSDFERPTYEFSGGWRMRIELAKLLLKKPEVLLLDEPTNHLDIESIQWLETYLSGYPGAVVLISHDRAFLDNVTFRTIEISMGRIYDYKVPYSEYVILHNERHEQQLAAFRNQQKMIEKTEDFIERFRYKATKAVQVQSRIRQLQKVERIKVDETDNSVIKLRFPPAPHSGNIVVEIKGLGKNYAEVVVLRDINLTITRRERIAFAGRNGEGKTTLSRIIVGELDHSGICRLGQNVKTGYFAQNQDELMNENLTVLETIDEAATGEMRTKVRDLLGAFLFSGEDIDKKVKVLSGGERSRLALAKMLLQPVNLLVLDEPTNHLDMASKDILKQALLKFDGTLIIVSHDRDFLNGLTQKVYEFKNAGIRENLGGIYDFLRNKKISSLAELERKDKELRQAKSSESLENKLIYEQRRRTERNIKRIEEKIRKIEELIETLEQDISLLNDRMSESTNNYDQSLFAEYEELIKRLNQEMTRWENYNTELEVWKEKRNTYKI